MTPTVPSPSLVLGGGCFWCLDAAFRLLPGVTQVTCGYAGGREANPTYEQICAHTTGHAEVVKIDFNPSQVTLDQLLQFFWKIHDPTQVGGQGHDHGPQYRSIILWADSAQQTAATQAMAAASQVFRNPLTTQLVPLEKFWPAEDYHQDYFAHNPHQGYCAAVIAPKIAKLQKQLG